MDPTVQLEDENKESSLEANGFLVIRFTNDQVLENIELVMKEIHLIQESRRLYLLSIELE